MPDIFASTAPYAGVHAFLEVHHVQWSISSPVVSGITQLGDGR